jgi:uncharacterized protein YjbI with pentapeptide repeats
MVSLSNHYHLSPIPSPQPIWFSNFPQFPAIISLQHKFFWKTKMSEDPFIVKQPREWFDKPIDFAIKEPLKAAVSAAGNAAVGNLPGAMTEAVKGLIDLFKGVKTDTPGEACFAMVLQAYQEALREYFTTHQPNRMNAKDVKEENLNRLVEELKNTLADKEYDARDALIKPRSFGMLKDLGVALEKWLKEARLNEGEVQGIVARIEGLYIKKFLEFSLKYTGIYQPFLDLANQIDSPFFKADQIKGEWERYREELRQLPDEPIFAEAFGLRPIYIPLRAKLKIAEKDKVRKRKATILTGGSQWEWVNLSAYLDSWVLGENSNLSNVQFISGGPGSGKSSFCKMWSAHLAEEHSEVYPIFVPLHRYRIEENLDKGVREFLNQNGFFNQVDFKLNGTDRQIILILDGLDELALSQGGMTQTLRDFIQSVLRLADNWKRAGNPVSVLISGREIAVEENERFFRDSAGWLKLLSYKIEENQTEKLKNLDELTDQREDWWRKFQELRGQELAGFPDSLRSNEKLEKLSREPLLNYLLAISMEEGLEINVETRTNDIYRGLIGSVYKRDYVGSPLPDVKSFGEERFFQALEEIAVACLRRETRSATVEQIEKQFHRAGKEKLLEDYHKAGQTGSSVKSLVVAFFFHAAKSKEGKGAFEFTHKSFMEYLIARKIVKLAVLMDEEMERNENPDTLGRGLNREMALVQWFELTGPSTLNREMIQFILEEASTLELEKAKAIQKRFAGFIGDASRENVPIVASADKTGVENAREFGYLADLFRNGTTALFAIASGVSGVTNDLTKPDWLESGRFGTLLRKICPQMTSNEFVPILECLTNLDLSLQNLIWTNLFGVNLVGANLERANLEGANLVGANLEGANLGRVKLFEVNLVGANLKRANLEWANLEGANLFGANLEGANLEGANLLGANLGRANLLGANLFGANLERVNFERADLSDADLRETNLIGTSFSWADFGRAKFDRGVLNKLKEIAN